MNSKKTLKSEISYTLCSLIKTFFSGKCAAGDDRDEGHNFLLNTI